MSDTIDRHSRRALLGAGLGAVAATAVAAIARPGTARAGDDGMAMFVGGEYDATSTTSITDNTSDATVFEANSNTGIGLYGSSASGNGVTGGTKSGVGVFGSSQTYRGVVGLSSDGTGVVARTVDGIAFEAHGRIQLSTSGVATIPGGATSVTVHPGVDVVASSFVLLTARSNIGSRSLWYSTNASTDAIVIHISSARPSATKVAWLLVG